MCHQKQMNMTATETITQTQRFLAQLQEESQTTRKMLSVVPEDKFDWKPHARSMTIRQLTTHIAELPGWVTMILSTEELDFAKNAYNPHPINSRAELLDYFEKELETACSTLKNADDEDMLPIWTLRSGDQVYVARPKEDMIRVSISQIIHHRAQLGVFLRLLDVAIPGTYGPSADEQGM